MNTNGVNKAIAAAKSVAKKSAKVFVVALPVLSIAETILTSHEEAGGNVAATVSRVKQKFTGISPVRGDFSWDDFMKGSGSLLISAGVAALLSMAI